jgi:glycerophosphoryl diester phosphodiesterase
MTKPLIIAHRGACCDAPENTLSAFSLAHQQGATWVEFDVRTCGSEELVIFHDDMLERTSSGYGSLATTPYAELKTLNAGSWFSSHFGHECIPTLAETLQLIQKLGLHANLELKPFPHKKIVLAKKTIALIQQQFTTLTSKLLISSFSLSCLRAVRKFDKTIDIGVLIHLRTHAISTQKLTWLTEQCRALDAVAIIVNEDKLNTTTMTQLKKLNIKVFSYTVNTQKRFDELAKLGVNGVFTDYPQKLP